MLPTRMFKSHVFSGMKNFFISFLGALAGIWLSIILLGILSVVILVAAAVSGASSSNISVDRHSVLYLDLDCNVTESKQPRNIMAELQGDISNTEPLNRLVSVIGSAADDDRIEGIFIDCNGMYAGLAQRQAIYRALSKFKRKAPEKWIYAYGDTYTQGDYFIACAADSIFINPEGAVDIHGLSATNLYFKGLLDKLGVNMQVVKVGTYKSAVEPYTMNGPSEASVEQQSLFLNNIWHGIRTMIARRRNVPADSVNSWANSLLMAKDTDFYLKSRIVDAKVYRHEMLKRLETVTGVDNLRLVTPSDYAQSGRLDKGDGKHAKIGVYYASGDIVDKGSEGISAEQVVPDIIKIAEEDEIDALVLRVNSGGGSAFASEQIWEAIGQYKAMTGKPVYVSMSDYAASGGYYISCGADRIYAEPLTLTGSIGIFGLIPDAEGLITGKLGVTTHTVSTNPSGDIPSLLKPMTPAQKVQMQAYVSRGYELFVSRVAEGRHMSVDSVKMIAEGRVWDGSEALKRGLVDKIGGLESVLADLAEELNVEQYRLIEYPDVTDKWWEALIEAGAAGVKTRIIRNSLGDMSPLYDAMLTLGEMSPVQARMEFLTVSM